LISIDSEGIRYRPALSFTTRLLRFDEIERVEGKHLLTRSGDRVRAPEPLRERVGAVLCGPSMIGSRAEIARAFEHFFAAPHGASRAARQLLSAAQARGASDLHLESTPSGAVVRFREAGELSDFCAVPAGAAPRLFAAFKGLAGCLPYRADVAQEGRIERSGICADVRASFLPTALGERAALRLFGKLLPLDQLGLSPEIHRRTLAALEGSRGLLLVAGGTGAGKTTTLYAMIAHLAATRPGAHLSLEDPVEQRLRTAGIPVDQIELEPARGITAEAMLAAALRQDVDALCVGEIRTGAEARLAMEAAHTGRLVLAGLHAGSCEEARQRMLDLGVESTLLAKTLRAVLHQQLVGASCSCGASASCATCHGTGRRRALEASIELSAPERVELRGVA
jgi:type II secretory ATPase GspE/PulE/Tfp pilus assembly ATPase PilB-like protein